MTFYGKRMDNIYIYVCISFMCILLVYIYFFDLTIYVYYIEKAIKEYFDD